MKKLISALLAAVMLSASSLTAFAEPELQTSEDEGIIVYSEYYDNINTQLSISKKKATCTSEVRGKSGKTTKIHITQTLQKQYGRWWIDVCSWSNTFYSSTATYAHTKDSLSSDTYRVETLAKIYQGSDYENVSDYSDNVSC